MVPVGPDCRRDRAHALIHGTFHVPRRSGICLRPLALLVNPAVWLLRGIGFRVFIARDEALHLANQVHLGSLSVASCPKTDDRRTRRRGVPRWTRFLCRCLW